MFACGPEEPIDPCLLVCVCVTNVTFGSLDERKHRDFILLISLKQFEYSTIQFTIWLLFTYKFWKDRFRSFVFQ